MTIWFVLCNVKHLDSWLEVYRAGNVTITWQLTLNFGIWEGKGWLLNLDSWKLCIEQVHEQEELVGCFCVSHPPGSTQLKILWDWDKFRNPKDREEDQLILQPASTHLVLSLKAGPRFLNRKLPRHISDIGGWRGSIQALWGPDVVYHCKIEGTLSAFDRNRKQVHLHLSNIQDNQSVSQ